MPCFGGAGKPQNQTIHLADEVSHRNSSSGRLAGSALAGQGRAHSNRRSRFIPSRKVLKRTKIKKNSKPKKWVLYVILKQFLLIGKGAPLSHYFVVTDLGFHLKNRTMSILRYSRVLNRARLQMLQKAGVRDGVGFKMTIFSGSQTSSW